MTRKPKIVIEVAHGIFQRIYTDTADNVWMVDVGKDSTAVAPLHSYELKHMPDRIKYAVQGTEKGKS